MLTREDAIKQTIDFITACNQSGIEIHKAILFGSVAKNQHAEFSDIDVALISNQFGNNSMLNNRMTSKINIKFPLLEVHHFNTEYFNTGDPFITEINATGYLIC